MHLTRPRHYSCTYMAVFECDRCGKCCVSLGPHIQIERQLNDRDYYCRCKIDNTLFLGHVDPAYQDDIAEEYAGEDGSGGDGEKKPCRFLRTGPAPGQTSCAIYASRPAVCREFRCYRMVILNRDGAVAGTVIGKNTLRTDDNDLKNAWERGGVAAFPTGDMAAWRGQVEAVLAGHGYHIEPVV